jgi:aspartate racemase
MSFSCRASIDVAELVMDHQIKVLGILGGLGPLASAEFLKTIYEHCEGEREQEWPAIMMLSDPSFPDRTEAFVRGEDNLLLERFVKSLRRLREVGAQKTVVCCVTLHHLVPRLSPDLREHVASLVDIVFADLARRGGRHLLLCSNGTRQMRIFQRHPRWESAKNQLVLPEPEDQDRIHYELIYALKRNADPRPKLLLIKALLAKYKVRSFVAGCTELHLIAKQLGDLSCIDPLDTLAREVAAGLLPDMLLGRSWRCHKDGVSTAS